ncbi:MAG: hypothetical protein K0R54_122 [Clostridiaceae bacterium]|nr:hypothetical protein [Clostridiaceae bacterium]
MKIYLINKIGNYVSLVEDFPILCKLKECANDFSLETVETFNTTKLEAEKILKEELEIVYITQ